MILLYHRVVHNNSLSQIWNIENALTQRAFERQIRWLANHNQIISLADYLKGMNKPGFKKQKPVAITFDDGFELTFHLISPFITKMKIPITIFVTTGHLESGNLLWFGYLKALCSGNKYSEVETHQGKIPLQTRAHKKKALNILHKQVRASGHPGKFCDALAERYPLDSMVTAPHAGMTLEQVRQVGKSDSIELGAHTITHPYLPQLPRDAQEKEIIGSMRTLSEITGRPVRYFAYPGGEYTRETINLVKNGGFEAAFAIIPRKTGTDSRFEISRVGIYSPSLLKVQLKVLGVANMARRLGLRVG